MTLLAGYLGSGKTTLVNHVLAHANGLRIAVMVNDFGDLPIDASLIDAEDDDIIQLSGGCVCCSYGNDLTRALANLQTLAVRPEHVLIECSGVALPRPVKGSLSLIPGLYYDGTVGLIDGSQVTQQLSDRYIGDTVERQIQQSDMLFINKIDLLTPEQLSTVKNAVSSLSSTRINGVTSAQIPVEVVLSSGINEQCESINASTKYALDDHHAQFEAKIIRGTKPLSLKQLSKQLMQADAGILRAKGYVFATDGKHYLLQMVGSSCEFSAVPVAANVRHAGEAETTFVVIGLKGQMQLDHIDGMTGGRFYLASP